METALNRVTIDVHDPHHDARTRSTGSTRRHRQNVKLTEAPGAEIRYLVFNTDRPRVKQQAVRQAIAQIIDRQAITRDVYKRTTEPLYSMVPQGITGHTNSFFNNYGEPERPAKAAATLQPTRTSPPRCR